MFQEQGILLFNNQQIYMFQIIIFAIIAVERGIYNNEDAGDEYIGRVFCTL